MTALTIVTAALALLTAALLTIPTIRRRTLDGSAGDIVRRGGLLLVAVAITALALAAGITVNELV